MKIVQEDKKFERLAQHLNPQNKLLRVWKLAGGVSAEVTAFEVEHPDGQIKKLIIRQHGEADRQHNPHIATDEFKLLHFLKSVQLPVPTPYYLGQSDEIFATPYLVIEYVEGKPEFATADLANFTRQLAAQLAQIHRIEPNSELAFLPKQEALYTAAFRESPIQVDLPKDEKQIWEALKSVCPLSQHNKSVLLHGDFWPGNVLWQNGRIVAIIDWEDARLGDPLADIANTRLEVLWALGIDAMQQFTHHYKSLMPLNFTNLPYWELYTAARAASKLATWGLDTHAEKVMRQNLHLFIVQANYLLPPLPFR